MTEEAKRIVAQAIVRRADGTSILDAGAITAANVAQFAVEPERIQDAARRLEERGFAVEARDQHTLSISGPAELFEKTFGLRPTDDTGPPSSGKVPSELADILADVVIPARPEFFP